MKAINPFIEIVPHEVALSSENALDILKDYDIIVDGTDNFPTRYLVPAAPAGEEAGVAGSAPTTYPALSGPGMRSPGRSSPSLMPPRLACGVAPRPGTGEWKISGWPPLRLRCGLSRSVLSGS